MPGPTIRWALQLLHVDMPKLKKAPRHQKRIPNVRVDHIERRKRRSGAGSHRLTYAGIAIGLYQFRQLALDGLDEAGAFIDER